MVCQFDQFGRGNAVFFIGVMRMGADRAIDIGKSLQYLEQCTEPPHPRRNGDDAANARGCGARHDAIEIVGKIREIEMAVAIDEHGTGRIGRGLDVSRETPASARAFRPMYARRLSIRQNLALRFGHPETIEQIRRRRRHSRLKPGWRSAG